MAEIVMAGLFLPFTPNGQETELAAIEVKRRLALGAYASVDPFAVLSRVPARILTHPEVQRLPNEIRDILFELHRNNWSAVGMGKSPATGEEIVLLNHKHHPRRQRVSLMEEIVHILLGHPRVPLVFNDAHRWPRPFDKRSEDEAYNVGAACILPYRTLFYQLKSAGADAAAIATASDVSQEYVQFRIKRAGLYRVFRKQERARPARSMGIPRR